MRPENNHRSLVTNGSQASTSFEISLKDSAHIMGILREGLYTDRILAVLREYGANAWDAHRAAGIPERPILVHVPTRNEPVFRVRDYGAGLSHDDMFAVFTQYGSSTKRGSDEVVGMLGIGSKSGFAYSDTFTVISRHGGRKRTYVAALDESEKGTLSLLADEACATDDTGLEVVIATKGNDHWEWQRRAEQLYRHFAPRPEINVTLPAPPTEVTKLTHGAIHGGSDSGEWIAVMGCVPYRVNLDQLDAALLPKCVHNLAGQLAFAIGEVAVSASREELKYTTATKAALVAKFTALVDEYVTQALRLLSSTTLSAWDSRLRVATLKQLDLPLPKDWIDDYGQSYVQVQYDPIKSGFMILHNDSPTTRINVDRDTRLWIDDAGKALKGYGLTPDDYIVRSRTLAPTALRAVLDAALVASKLTGIQVGLLSAKDWQEWRVPKKRVSNPKHRAKMFRLINASHNRGEAYSDCWEAVDRVPEDTDVFVTLKSFKPSGNDGWYIDQRRTAKIATTMGESVPEIYGYKSTEKRPANPTTGQPWAAWCRGVYDRAKQIVTANAEALVWAELPHSGYGSPSYSLRCATKNDLQLAINRLDPASPVAQLLVRVRDARDAVPAQVRAVAQLVIENHPIDTSNAHSTINAVLDAYPLMRERRALEYLWSASTTAAPWIEYVQLIDAKYRLLSTATTAATATPNLKIVK